VIRLRRAVCTALYGAVAPFFYFFILHILTCVSKHFTFAARQKNFTVAQQHFTQLCCTSLGRSPPPPYPRFGIMGNLRALLVAGSVEYSRPIRHYGQSARLACRRLSRVQSYTPSPAPAQNPHLASYCLHRNFWVIRLRRAVCTALYGAVAPFFYFFILHILTCVSKHFTFAARQKNFTVAQQHFTQLCCTSLGRSPPPPYPFAVLTHRFFIFRRRELRRFGAVWRRHPYSIRKIPVY